MSKAKYEYGHYLVGHAALYFKFLTKNILKSIIRKLRMASVFIRKAVRYDFGNRVL